MEDSKKSSSERFFETILKIHRITGWVTEFKFHEKRRWRLDFAFPEKKIAVEIDGGQWVAFGGRHNRDSDRKKINIATSLGWLVVRFSTQQVREEPTECIEILKKIINLRSI